MNCDACNIEMIAIEKRQAVGAAGLFGATLFLIGVALLFANVIAGLIVILLAILIGRFGAANRLVMTCPQCGHKTKPIKI